MPARVAREGVIMDSQFDLFDEFQKDVHLTENEKKLINALMNSGDKGLSAPLASKICGFSSFIVANNTIANIGKKFLKYVGKNDIEYRKPYEIITDPYKNYRGNDGLFYWVLRDEIQKKKKNTNAKKETVELGQRYVEGKSRDKVHIAYERNRKAREACIAIKGTTCEICGFDFYDMYGAIGKGFIEVHHVAPISKTGINAIDPENDLLVVCSNCHSMIHRRENPYSKKEMVKKIKRA